jgi:rhodanese-related sulfurtransferase
MRKIAVGIILAGMLLSAFLLIPPVAAEETGYQNISVQQARKMIKHDSGNLVILDVRNQSEYDLGHLYGAILIPVYEIENRTISQSLPEPPANDSLLRSIHERVNSGFKLQAHVNDKIIVYCQAGSRSTQACQILVAHGFIEVYNMIGGIIAWMQADYPIYTSYHHVTVDFTGQDQQILIDIAPWLLYQSS